MQSWQTVGEQRFRIEDDTVTWNVRGAISGRDIRTIFEEAFQVQCAHGYTLLCVHITGEWSFPLDARRALAEFHQSHKAIGATAVVGASAKTAMFIDLVLRGVAKMSGHRPKTRFFGAISEAMTWLGQERTQFAPAVG